MPEGLAKRFELEECKALKGGGWLVQTVKEDMQYEVFSKWFSRV